MIPAEPTEPVPRRQRAPAAPPGLQPGLPRATSWAAALGALAVLATGCAAPAAADSAPDPHVPRAPAPAAELTEEDVNAWLDGVLPTALDTADIPGASVSVVHEGELLTARGYGYADTGADGGAPVPVDPDDTLFRVGSIAKVFTATAVMQQVEAGEVDLDTDVHEYLDFTVPTAFDEPITVRHLLTHTPGFEERIRGAFTSGGDEIDLREYLSTDPPEQVYPPGTTPAYSNYGIDLAGYIVELVSGVPFEEYVQDHVLEPLGMDSSTFVQPLPEELDDRLAGGYDVTGDPAQPFEFMANVPAGSLTSSATDMAKFMIAHMGQLGDGPSVLEPAALEEMHSPGLEPDSLGTLTEGPQMTLGFLEEDRNGHRIIGHGGDTLLFHAEMQFMPEEGTGIFVVLNGSGSTDAAYYLLRKDLMADFFDRYFPGEAPGEESGSVEATAAEHAAMAEGAYITSRKPHSTFPHAVYTHLLETKVEARADGTILVSPDPAKFAPVVYEEIEPWVWREVGGQRVISMRLSEDGESVEAIGADPTVTLLRVEPGRQTSVTLPILLASVAVLLVTVLAWPIAALRRRVRSLPAPDRDGRLARVLTRTGAVSALTALVCWPVFIVLAMSGSGQDIPAAALRAAQGLQLLGALVFLPADWTLVQNIRNRAGWQLWAGSALVLAALTGVLWFALTFSLLSPTVSY